MGKLKRKEWLKTTKKMLSVALLSALVVTTIPAVSADAAAKPKLNKKKVTIRVGKKYTLKVVNKIKGSKYTWKSNKKKVATVTKKGVVKGKKKGNAVITCMVKAPSKTYKLTCNVKVKKAAKTTKPTPTPQVNTSATVSTQSELESALKNEALTSILLKTDAESKFTIPAGTYSKKTLTVNAPNAEVENEGIFKEVKIQEIKASTWKEKAKGNILILLDKSIRVIVTSTGQVKEIIVEGNDSSVNLEVEGTVTKLTIKKKTKMEIIGSNNEGIPVEVTSEGKDTELISEVPINVSLNADTEVTLKKGAEESKVEKKVDSIKIVVENQTSVTITITTPSGNQTVSAGSKVTIEIKGDTTTTTPGTSSGGGGGSLGGDSNPTPSEEKVSVTKITLSQEKGYLISGDSLDLTAVIEPENATDKTLEWTSSDEKIAVVDSTGKITAGKKATGTAIITAKAKDGSGVTGTCEVTVYSSVEEKINVLIATNNTQAITIDLLKDINANAKAENLASYQATLAKRQKVSESVIINVNGVIDAIKYDNIKDDNHKILNESIKSGTGCAISNRDGKVLFQLAPINSSNYYVNKDNNRIYMGPQERGQNAGNDSFTYKYSKNVTHDNFLGDGGYIPSQGDKKVNIAFIYVQMQNYGDDVKNDSYVKMIPVLYSLAVDGSGTVDQTASWVDKSISHTSATLVEEWHPVKESQITINNTSTNNEPIVIVYCVEESESLKNTKSE